MATCTVSLISPASSSNVKLLSSTNSTASKLARSVRVNSRIICSSPHSSSSSSNPIGCDASTFDVARRQALLGASAASLSLLLPALGGRDEAMAADLIERGQRAEYLGLVKSKLASAIEKNQELIPQILLLFLNDVASYDKESKSGGANGSIHFSDEISREENAGLAPALALLTSVKSSIDVDEETGVASKWGPISYSDLLVFGAQSAVKRLFLNAAISKAGGDEAKGKQLYVAFGSSGQWGYFDKLFGRADAESSDPIGRVPDWKNASTEEIKLKFAQLGLKPRDIAVLSVFFGAPIEETEAKFSADEEIAPYVTKYQKSRLTTSQNSYEVDLITAFTKLSKLGAPINFEAYTYDFVRKPIKL